MDPNANLQEQEQLIAVAYERKLRRVELDRLADLREALGEWLEGGGFAPDWTLAPRARKYWGQ